MANPPALSFFDGIGNGLGYSAMLIVLGIVRELFGAGKLMGYTILPVVNGSGGWYLPNGMLLLPPSSILLNWFNYLGTAHVEKEQVEAPDFSIAAHSQEKEAYWWNITSTYLLRPFRWKHGFGVLLE